MKKSLPKKQLLYWLFFSFFFQAAWVTQVSAQPVMKPFVTTWQANSNYGKIKIPTNPDSGSSYNYTIK